LLDTHTRTLMQVLNIFPKRYISKILTSWFTWCKGSWFPKIDLPFYNSFKRFLISNLEFRGISRMVLKPWWGIVTCISFISLWILISGQSCNTKWWEKNINIDIAKCVEFWRLGMLRNDIHIKKMGPSTRYWQNILATLSKPNNLV